MNRWLAGISQDDLETTWEAETETQTEVAAVDTAVDFVLAAETSETQLHGHDSEIQAESQPEAETLPDEDSLWPRRRMAEFQAETLPDGTLPDETLPDETMADDNELDPPVEETLPDKTLPDETQADPTVAADAMATAVLPRTRLAQAELLLSATARITTNEMGQWLLADEPGATEMLAQHPPEWVMPILPLGPGDDDQLQGCPVPTWMAEETMSPTEVAIQAHLDVLFPPSSQDSQPVEDSQPVAETQAEEEVLFDGGLPFSIMFDGGLPESDITAETHEQAEAESDMDRMIRELAEANTDSITAESDILAGSPFRSCPVACSPSQTSQAEADIAAETQEQADESDERDESDETSSLSSGASSARANNADNTDNNDPSQGSNAGSLSPTPPPPGRDVALWPGVFPCRQLHE